MDIRPIRPLPFVDLARLFGAPASHIQERIIAFVPVSLALLLLAAAPAKEFDPSYLQQYQGTYRFDDGLCVTGGRMDESGRKALLFMDVWTNRTSEAFEPTDNGFQSIFGAPKTLRFSGDGDLMQWAAKGGESKIARRIRQPVTRPAHFGNDSVALTGTLYLPADASGPVPAVVLAHGSGPANRFGGTWITFFTDLGFAVLSYDKRGVGQSGGDWRESNYLDLAGDLSEAVDWLAAQPGIDSRRVGIHSSSQSGWYSPYAARHDPKVAFLIQRVGPALPVGPTTRHENEEEWRADGLSEQAIKSAGDLWSALHALAASGGSLDQAQALLEKAQAKPWFEPTFGMENWSKVRAGWWNRQLVNAKIDPAGDTAHLHIPVLWFLAEKDENVPYAKSRAALEEAQKKAPVDLTIVTIEGAKHSFIIEGKDGQARYTDRYWPVMADWLSNKGISSGAAFRCTAF